MGAAHLQEAAPAGWVMGDKGLGAAPPHSVGSLQVVSRHESCMRAEGSLLFQALDLE